MPAPTQAPRPSASMSAAEDFFAHAEYGEAAYVFGTVAAAAGEAPPEAEAAAGQAPPEAEATEEEAPHEAAEEPGRSAGAPPPAPLAVCAMPRW